MAVFPKLPLGAHEALTVRLALLMGDTVLCTSMCEIPGVKLGYRIIFLEMSVKTSTTSIFQIIDEPLFEEFRRYLQGDKKRNFVRGINAVHLQNEMRHAYPTITNIVMGLAKENGMFPPHIAHFILAVLDHTLNVYRESQQREENEYTLRTVGEIFTQLLNSAQQINLIWLKLALSLPVISWLVIRHRSRRLTFHILE